MKEISADALLAYGFIDLIALFNFLSSFKANSMGLLGRGRGRGAVARGRGSTTWVASGIAAPPPVVGRGRGRGALLGHASVAARTLDRRPKQVEVTGFTVEEKEEVALHLGVCNTMSIF